MTQPYWPPQPPPAKRGPNWWLIGGAVALTVVLVAALVVVGGVLIANRVRASPHPHPVHPGIGASCSYQPSTGAARARKVKLPQASGVPDTGAATVHLATSQGDLILSLDRARTPCTVNSFVSLARQKYFDNTRCHRLVTKGIFVLQCGDPSGTGGGGPGYSFADESLPPQSGASVTYPAGTVAMANAGPGTNGSQFFLVYTDSPLPPSYTIFGTITEGLDLVRHVAAGGTDTAASTGNGDGPPKIPVQIESVTTS